MITEHDLEAFGYWSHELPETNKTPMEMVKEYAKTSGQKPDANLYAALIEEEFKEWFHEFIVYGTSDTNQLKELADLLYVIYGYANAKGWDVEETKSDNRGTCCCYRCSSLRQDTCATH